MELATEKK